MNTWTVTSNSRCGHRTVIGAGDTAEQAREQIIAATHAMINQAAGGARARYTLHLGGELAAIIQTGDDELGLPDHSGAAELLSRMQHTRNPFGN